MLIFLAVPASSQAADVHIPCEDVAWIEVSKTPPGLVMSMEDLRGSCKGEDCFLLTLHLTNKGTTDLHTQALDAQGQTPNIYIGNELVLFGRLWDIVPPVPVDLYSRISDWSAFATHVEAEKRAAAICAGTSIKYTGIIGETLNTPVTK